MPDYLPDYILDELKDLFKLQKDVAVYVKKHNIFKEAVPLEQRAPKDNTVSYADSFVPFFIHHTYALEEHRSSQLFIYKAVDKNSGDWYAVERNNFSNEDQHDARYRSNQYIVMAIEQQCTPENHIAEIKSGRVVRATDKAEFLYHIHDAIYSYLADKGFLKSREQKPPEDDEIIIVRRPS